MATEQLRNFTISTAFIGVSGITEAGITVADLSEARLKAAVIERASRVVVPLDHSKIGLADFAHVCPLNQIDIVVTDASNDYLVRICQANEIQLIVTKKSRIDLSRTDSNDVFRCERFDPRCGETRHGDIRSHSQAVAKPRSGQGAIELLQWLAREPTMFKPKAGKRFVIRMPNDRE